MGINHSPGLFDGKGPPVFLFLMVGLSGLPALASNLELTLQVGQSLPFYEQSFALDPGDLGLPEIPIASSGGFDLELDGGLTLSGALTWRFSESLGLEVRVDSAKVDLKVTGGSVSADLGDFIPELPSIPISGEISGEAEIGRLTPFSVNLQFVAGDKVKFVVSGGASYMPATSVAATVFVGLGAGGIPGFPELTFPDLSVSAAANVKGGFGGNLGVGLQVPLGSKTALVVEARAFGFPKQELRWGTGSGNPSEIEKALGEALDPIEFQYGFFQATGGLLVRF